MRTDHEVHRDIVEELGCDGRVGGLDVDVTVKDGVVTLSGAVRTIAQLVAAERAMESIEGVKRIKLDLTVTLDR
jgi:osmotically-inducible protein OsmY